MDSMRRSARVAGAVYVVMGVSCLFGLVCAPLVVADAQALADRIGKPGAGFRVAVAFDLLTHVCGVVLAVLLYRLFRGVDALLAMLMAGLYLAAVPMSFAITLSDVAAHAVLTGSEAAAVFTAEERNALAVALARAHIHGTQAAEMFWGLWLVPLGLLVRRSGFLPRVLGVLLIVSGVVYAVHSASEVLGAPWVQARVYTLATMVGRGVGELPFMLWLAVMGVRPGRAAGAG